MMEVALALVLGLVIGSFLNVVILRLPQGMSISTTAIPLPAMQAARFVVRQHSSRQLSHFARTLPPLRKEVFRTVSFHRSADRPGQRAFIFEIRTDAGMGDLLRVLAVP